MNRNDDVEEWMKSESEMKQIVFHHIKLLLHTHTHSK